jgi:hypothetical protein
MSNLYLECACSSNEHLVKVTYDVDSGIPSASFVSIEVQLSKQSWYRRIWPAIKYVFGYESKYGHWDETLLNLQQVGKLHALLHTFSKEVEEAKSLESSKETT